MKKYLILIIFLLNIFFPVIVFAQTATPSLTLDQRCMTASDCRAARSRILQPPEGGFYTSEEATTVCGSKIFGADGVEDTAGFCLPASEAKLQIGIGGRTDFGNVAEYIQYIYKYSMFVAITLAIVITILSGLQWILSGGESGKIDAARKRIIGSVTGLILLAVSYTILNTINPALVNLRLPQVWMIRESPLISPDCSKIASPPAKFTLVDLTNPNSPVPSGSPLEYNQTDCGKSYIVSTGGAQTCQSFMCRPEPGTAQVCAPSREVPGQYGCTSGFMAGKINSSSGGINFYSLAGPGVEKVVNTVQNALAYFYITEGSRSWKWEWLYQPGFLDEPLNLYLICDGKTVESTGESIVGYFEKVGGISTDIFPIEADKSYIYVMKSDDARNLYDNAIQTCLAQGNRNFSGFVVEINLNEAGNDGEKHMLGINGDEAVDLGVNQRLTNPTVLDLVSSDLASQIISLLSDTIFEDIIERRSGHNSAIERYLINPFSTSPTKIDSFETGMQFNIDVDQITDVDYNEEAAIVYRDFLYIPPPQGSNLPLTEPDEFDSTDYEYGY